MDVVRRAFEEAGVEFIDENGGGARADNMSRELACGSAFGSVDNNQLGLHRGSSTFSGPAGHGHPDCDFSRVLFHR
jgi:hypothetical protein